MEMAPRDYSVADYGRVPRGMRSSLRESPATQAEGSTDPRHLAADRSNADSASTALREGGCRMATRLKNGVGV